MTNPHPDDSSEWLLYEIFSGGTSLDWCDLIHDATWEGDQ